METSFVTAIPFYYQIKESLQQRIAQGEFPPHTKLPAETLLAQAYGVSRPTIRQAILELVRENVVTRHRGKGTFVLPPRVVGKPAWGFNSFAQEIEACGLKPSARLLLGREMEAPPGLAGRLEVPPGDPLIEVVLLRYGNGEPIMITTVVVPSRLGPDLLSHDLEHTPVIPLLQRQYGLEAHGSFQWFSATLASVEEGDWLDVPPGHPLLHRAGLILDANRHPFMWTTALYRSDRYQFVLPQGCAEEMDHPAHPNPDHQPT